MLHTTGSKQKFLINKLKPTMDLKQALVEALDLRIE